MPRVQCNLQVSVACVELKCVGQFKVHIQRVQSFNRYATKTWWLEQGGIGEKYPALLFTTDQVPMGLLRSSLVVCLVCLVVGKSLCVSVTSLQRWQVQGVCRFLSKVLFSQTPRCCGLPRPNLLGFNVTVPLDLDALVTLLHHWQVRLRVFAISCVGWSSQNVVDGWFRLGVCQIPNFLCW